MRTSKPSNPSRSKRTFSAEEKTRAVLEVWTESRRPCQIARELEITGTLLDQWQKKAMKAILAAMEPRGSDPAKAPLPPRLENILKAQMQRVPLTRLAKRMQQVQAGIGKKEPVLKRKATRKKPTTPKEQD